jgi:hypothetical protein
MLYPLSYRGRAASHLRAADRTISARTHRGPQTSDRPRSLSTSARSYSWYRGPEAHFTASEGSRR